MLVAKNAYRRELIAGQSGRCICGYVYASAGVGESTTDLVFSGACTVAENGSILAESERFSRTGSRAVACIDVAKLSAERRKNGSFHDNAVDFSEEIPTVTGVLPHLELCRMDRSYDPTPFIPGDQRTREERCKEIFAIQAAGLAKRLSHTGLKRAVIGISGGLDSTLALLVASETMKLLQYPSENILCITMPGFGTTDRTYQNALELIASLGAELREIDIRPACIQHMKDIGHDPSIHDITYENTQARERTQILMDLANKSGGLLVGTGDLSVRRLQGLCHDTRLYLFSDNHDVERLPNKLRNREHIRHIAILVYTLWGIPSIYYGSEFGIEGKKEWGSDWPLRPCLELSDFKDAETTNPVTSVYAALGRLKAELPELTDGEVKELQLTTQCYAFARVLDGKACVVVLNNGDSPAQLEFQLPVEASSAKDLLADTVGAQPVLTSMEWGRMKVQLPSNYATILQLEK